MRRLNTRPPRNTHRFRTAKFQTAEPVASPRCNSIRVSPGHLRRVKQTGLTAAHFRRSVLTLYTRRPKRSVQQVIALEQ